MAPRRAGPCRRNARLVGLGTERAEAVPMPQCPPFSPELSPLKKQHPQPNSALQKTVLEKTSKNRRFQPARALCSTLQETVNK